MVEIYLIIINMYAAVCIIILCDSNNRTNPIDQALVNIPNRDGDISITNTSIV